MFFDFDVKSLLLGGAMGFILGISFGIIVNRKNVSREKKIASTVFAMWMVMHLLSFVGDKDIPYIFDFVGAAATGSLLGFDVANFISQIIPRK